MNVVIEKTSWNFLSELTKNNNREWFQLHREHYLMAHENMIAFANALLGAMLTHDNIATSSGKSSLMRIYRDTRFSKDKTPYKTYFGGGFQRATKKLRGGYYFQIGPGKSLAAGGFFGPNPDDLHRIRKDMDANYTDWKKLLSNKKLVHTFDGMKGEQVVHAPKGFARDNPAIELLKYKQIYFERTFSDKEVLDKNFLIMLNQTFKNLRPFFDYMSEVLTTDSNGISLI